MKKITVIILLIMFGSCFSFAQNFNLNSKKFTIGDTYVSNPKILFDIASYEIRTESYSQLDSIAAFLIKYDSLIIEVGAHLDNRASNHSSRRLDQKRAESIVEYLIEKGINSDRLIAKGYHGSKLLISKEDIKKMKTPQEKEKAHSINRRVEFKIIEIRT